MPTPINLVRAVHDLNEALTDAGHPDLVRTDDAWAEAAHDYIGQRAFNDFLEDSLAPVMDRLDATERPDPDTRVRVEQMAHLLAALWDAVPYEGDRGPSAQEVLTITATAEQAALHPGFLRAVADLCEAALMGDELQVMRSPQDWAEVVLRHMPGNDLGAYATEAIYEPLLGGLATAPTDSRPAPGLDELDEWIALATEIWNNTPQPDRGFRTAYEIALDGEAAQERASARAKRKRAKKGRRR